MLVKHCCIGEFRRFRLFFRNSEDSGCNNYSKVFGEMFTSYTDSVFKAYQMKKEKGKLSLNLVAPTPAKLKQECSIVYSERYKEKDSKTLRLFFLPKDDPTDYGISIRNTDTDRFKPLSNFLKGKTSETEDKNIELLAWLIDFEPRPYNFKFNYEAELGDPDDNKTDREELSVNKWGYENSEQKNFLEKEKDESKYSSEGDEKKGKTPELSLKNILIGGVLSCSFILVGYLGVKDKGKKIENYQEKMMDSSETRKSIMAEPSDIVKKPIIENKKDNNAEDKISTVYIPAKKEMQCMYWKDDHYQEAFCDDENVPASLIAIDENLVENFKKITFPDTITEKSVGKIWYLKSDGKIEFFTHEGNHPTNHRKLKKMTKYILDKHVYN